MFGIAVALILSAPPPVAASPWVTVRGQIVLPKSQDVPELAAVNVFTDKAYCCGAGPIVDLSCVIDPKTRGIQGVVVWLRPDDTDPKSLFPKDRIHPDLATTKPVDRVIDIPRCQFEPRILGVRVGDALVIKNPAPIAHNCRLQGNQNEVNRIIPAGKEPVRIVEKFQAETIPIALKDDIHPWMTGYLRVFDHPYFAVTDAAGRFEIPKVPAGPWRVIYWHERGYHKGRDGRLGFPITVKDGGAGRQELPPLEFEFPKPQ